MTRDSENSWTAEQELDQQISFGIRDGWLPSGLGSTEFYETKLRSAMQRVINTARKDQIERIAKMADVWSGIETELSATRTMFEFAKLIRELKEGVPI